MQILLCPLEALSRLMMAVNESEDDSELPGIQTYCAYRFKSIFSQDGNLLPVFILCVKSHRTEAVERTVLTWVLMKHTAWQTGETLRWKKGVLSKDSWCWVTEAGRLFTNTSCFKIMRCQPRILKNAAVPTLDRILSIAKIGIQELQLLWISIVYRLLHLLSCNLSKSRNSPS